MKHLIKAIRPPQWIKNLFIFLPLIFGQKLLVYPENVRCLIAFFVFSMAASAVYLINDMIDIDKDRVHPTKRNRPIAAGKISIPQAVVYALTLATFALGASFWLAPALGWVVVTYLVFNLFYSFYLKEEVIIDVFCIGAFFLLRIGAGTVVTGVEWSYWMSFMIVLLALFLGFNKRRQELDHLKDQAEHHRKVLKKYSAYFIDQMISVVTASIVVVYMLYTVDARTVGMFQTNHLIYSIPFVYYGIFRYLWLIHKENRDGDPTTILLSDGKMQINIAFWVGVCISVIYFGL